MEEGKETKLGEGRRKKRKGRKMRKKKGTCETWRPEGDLGLSGEVVFNYVLQNLCCL